MVFNVLRTLPSFLVLFNSLNFAIAFVGQSTINSIVPRTLHHERRVADSSLLSSSLESSTLTTKEEDISSSATTTSKKEEDLEAKRRRLKQSLFGIIGSNGGMTTQGGGGGVSDSILADPITKESLTITTNGPIFGGQSSAIKNGVRVTLKSSTKTYVGRTSSYYNLLSSSASSSTDKEEDDDVDTTTSSSKENNSQNVLNSLRDILIPPQIQVALSTSGILPKEDFVPMRDLFTSPQVSFAYERGWRQGFAAAGFPGADAEYEMVKEYFAPINPKTVVDMSCATGLFTRRLAKSNEYQRVIGCDYSDAMLLEARNRINADDDLSRNNDGTTRLDLIRCDVGEIPMKSESVDALHAGAAMHCWPDLDSALSEIHRVLKPNGGRFFASTFLATYFRGLQRTSTNASVQEQTFQYFESVQFLEDLLLKAGFTKDKLDIEVLGAACVIIRAEK